MKYSTTTSILAEARTDCLIGSLSQCEKAAAKQGADRFFRASTTDFEDKPGGHRLPFTRFESELAFDCCAQISPGCARGGVTRQGQSLCVRKATNTDLYGHGEMIRQRTSFE